MQKEFLIKLRASLEALDARIASLEHIVNDTIIGGLQKAAEEYEDDIHFSDFCDAYSPEYKDLVEPATIIYGSDYDLPSALYEEIKAHKSAEGFDADSFDEKAEVEKLLQGIRDKIDALKALEEKVEEKVETETPVDEPETEPETEEDIPSEEQLAEEFRIYNHE